MRYLFILCLGFAACNTSADLRLSDNERNGIQANFDRQVECWNRGDLECYVEAYYPSENVQTITRLGITRGVTPILARYKKSFPEGRMGQLHFDEITHKKLSRRYAYVVGRYNLKFNDRDDLVQGWFSVLMEKIEGKWYLISDHS